MSSVAWRLAGGAYYEEEAHSQPKLPAVGPHSSTHHGLLLLEESHSSNGHKDDGNALTNTPLGNTEDVVFPFALAIGMDSALNLRHPGNHHSGAG